MEKWIGYQNGINLGGWLSQCKPSKEHYDTFIKESDIKIIADSGMDHVRLPIDYNLVQDEHAQFIPEHFQYIDNCIAWCTAYGLNLVLDLHKTAGYSFNTGNDYCPFFYEEDKIQQFLDLWEELARRFGKYPNVAFELLNEVVSERDNAPWMQIAARTIEVIRKHTKDTKILVGSYLHNSVLTVKHIADFDDDNIVYNFHCYEPLLFTHQGARWIKAMPDDLRIKYPISKEEFEPTNRSIDDSQFHDATWAITDTGFGTEYFENLFREAIAVAERKGVMLYCGEYGVIKNADKDSKVAWFRDIDSVLEKYGIGKAKWSYKRMSFGIFIED